MHGHAGHAGHAGLLLLRLLRRCLLHARLPCRQVRQVPLHSRIQGLGATRGVHVSACGWLVHDRRPSQAGCSGSQATCTCSGCSAMQPCMRCPERSGGGVAWQAWTHSRCPPVVCSQAHRHAKAACRPITGPEPCCPAAARPAWPCPPQILDCMVTLQQARHAHTQPQSSGAPAPTGSPAGWDLSPAACCSAPRRCLARPPGAAG